MSTKYQKPFVIPEGFPALLKRFTREILRAQVPNMLPASQGKQPSTLGTAASTFSSCIGGGWTDLVLPYCVCLQPDNIYEFGARYFKDLLEHSKGSQPVSGAPAGNVQAEPASGLNKFTETATTLDLTKLTAAELEPIILSEWGFIGRQHASLNIPALQLPRVASSSPLHLSWPLLQTRCRAVLGSRH
jgi:hypothetical protein